MSREKMKKLARKCRRGLSRPLPLTVGEWLCAGAASTLLLAPVFLWLLRRGDLHQGLVSFLTLKPLPTVELAERVAALLFPVLTLLVGRLWSSMKGRVASAGEHRRGRRLIGEKELASQAKDSQGLLPFGPVLLPRRYEERHVLVAGDRAGRAAVLALQLEAIRRAGLPAVVHDPAGEFAAKFYRPGVDHIANPFDARSVSWNLFDDLESLAELSGLAESVAPYNTAAQDLLRGTLAALMFQGKRTHADLWEALGSPVGSLARLCASVEQGEAGCRVLADPSGPEAERALALLRSRLAWLEFARGEGGFSVKKWLAGPGGSFVFLTSHPEVGHTLRPYRSLLVELFGRWLLTLPKAQAGGLFFVLDELAELQTLPGIKRLLIHAGERGAAVILGVRDLASLECRYLDADVQAILNGCASLMALRLPDGRTADYFSWRFGDTEYWDDRALNSKGEPESPGLGPGPLIRRADRLLIGSQFMDLGDLAGYLLTPDSHPSLVTLAPGEADRLPAVAPPFLLRAGFSLDDPAVKGEGNGGREVRLGIPGAPEASAAAGVAVDTGPLLDPRLEF